MLINHTNASQGSDGPDVIYVGSTANYTDFTDDPGLGQNMYADLTENILEESNVVTINTGDPSTIEEQSLEDTLPLTPEKTILVIHRGQILPELMADFSDVSLAHTQLLIPNGQYVGTG